MNGEEAEGWAAELEAGPFDGATVSFDMSSSELPGSVVVTFVVDEGSDEALWHSYVLEPRTRSARYLGEDHNRPDTDAGWGVGARVHSLALLEVPDDGLTRRFYELLFERYPDVRHLFATDLREQAAMLRTALRATLEHLGDPEWLSTALGALGAQHAAWGVTAPMYDAFEECMLAAMAELSHDGWTPALAAEWSATFHEVRDLMLAGAAQEPPAQDGPEPRP
jgi:hemoglobin-like flavoprotein